MPLDTRIALGGQPLQLESPLAQYGQLMNVVNAGTQNQLAQMQMQENQQMAPLRMQEMQSRAAASKLTYDQAKEAQDFIAGVMSKAAEHPEAPRDPMEAAQQMLMHPNAQVQAVGTRLLDASQKINEYKQQQQYLRDQGTPPVNALAPSSAAPVNALATKTAADIMAQITKGDVQYGKAPGWQAQRALLVDQYKEAVKTPVFHTVAEGAALIGPDGKPIYTAPAKTPTPSDVSRLIAERNAAVAAGAPPDEIAALNAAIKKASTHQPPTNINVNAGQRAEDVEFGKYVVDQYKAVSDQAKLATKSLPAIDINLRTLDKGFDTGFGTETKAAGANVLAALGVKDAAQYATDAQTFLANANSAVLQKQIEQKGPQTESDAQRINATGAQLGNTKEANRFILNVAKAQLQRDIDQRKFYSDWQSANKTFKGAEAAWAEGPGSVSLFDSPILKKYAEPVTGQAEARKVGLDNIFKKKP